ncbi:uncharacterized protein GGS25DRAFT_517215 [Hypoxylon fragiforme]|uniref:uncharacterized protein n=1 Tax=Hypoxylon fragiforme TaxID=63214 RepID=UPI0020C732EA|nr:uncharacterized protein GGS25DRAFT_517215 [Hypoxylon fragiforme]KAI2614366.1 hypothetical protein GGS25DRAFT_517215 [Hypoxylon fragiforme]
MTSGSSIHPSTTEPPVPILVVTATTGNPPPVVTYTPVQLSDKTTVTAKTTSNGIVIFPLGMVWSVVIPKIGAPTLPAIIPKIPDLAPPPPLVIPKINPPPKDNGHNDNNKGDTKGGSNNDNDKDDKKGDNKGDNKNDDNKDNKNEDDKNDKTGDDKGGGSNENNDKPTQSKTTTTKPTKTEPTTSQTQRTSHTSSHTSSKTSSSSSSDHCTITAQMSYNIRKDGVWESFTTTQKPTGPTNTCEGTIKTTTTTVSPTKAVFITYKGQIAMGDAMPTGQVEVSEKMKQWLKNRLQSLYPGAGEASTTSTTKTAAPSKTTSKATSKTTSKATSKNTSKTASKTSSKASTHRSFTTSTPKPPTTFASKTTTKTSKSSSKTSKTTAKAKPTERPKRKGYTCDLEKVDDEGSGGVPRNYTSGVYMAAARQFCGGGYGWSVRPGDRGSGSNYFWFDSKNNDPNTRLPAYCLGSAKGVYDQWHPASKEYCSGTGEVRGDSKVWVEVSPSKSQAGCRKLKEYKLDQTECAGNFLQIIVTCMSDSGTSGLWRESNDNGCWDWQLWGRKLT